MTTQQLERTRLPSNLDLARSWLASEQSDEAYDIFEGHVLEIFRARRFTKGRLKAIQSRIGSDLAVRIQEDIEKIATEPSRDAVLSNGDQALVVGRLFAIPLIGDLASMDQMVKNPAALAAVAATLPASGFIAKSSNSLIYPVLYSINDVAKLAPDDLVDISVYSMEALSFGAKTPAAEASLRAARLHLRSFLPPVASSEVDVDASDTVGVRILIAAQLTVLREGEDLPGDGLDLLSDAPETDEEAEMVGDCLRRWAHALQPLVMKTGVFVSNPLPWGDVRLTMIDIHIDRSIDAALQAAKQPFVTQQIDLQIGIDPRGMTFYARHNDQDIAQVTVHPELVAGAVTDLIEGLSARYRSIGHRP